MVNSITILERFRPYIKDARLAERVQIAAKIIHEYRHAGQSTSTGHILRYLGVQDDDVADVYKKLYGRPLHLNRVPPLQEGEHHLFFDSSETGVTDAQLYYLRSKNILELRLSNGNLVVNRANWEDYRNRKREYASLAKAADLLGVSRPYVRELIRKDILPAIRPDEHTYGNMYLIKFGDLEALLPRLEWINLSEGGRRYGVTRERSRQVLEAHTLSAHTDKRQNGRKKIRSHWKRIRKPHEVLVRALDFELHYQSNNN